MVQRLRLQKMPFNYEDLLPIGADQTKYRLVTKDGVKVIKHGDLEFLEVFLAETIHSGNWVMEQQHINHLQYP